MDPVASFVCQAAESCTLFQTHCIKLVNFVQSKRLIFITGSRSFEFKALSFYILKLKYKVQAAVIQLCIREFKEATTATPKTKFKKMNLYFTYESRDTLKSFTLFITVKTITKLNLEYSDNFEIEFYKISPS